MKTTTTTFISSKKNLCSLVITWAQKHRRVHKGHSVSYCIYKDTVSVDITMPDPERLQALANLKRVLS